MADDLTTTWRHLIARLQRDDAAARQEVMARAYDRLRRRTGHLFNRDFPDLVGRHELDSALNEAWIRLTQALASTTPATPADFFRLAAHKIRQVLLDMVERQRRWDAREAQLLADDSSLGGPQDPADRTHDPARLSLWTEFHRQAEPTWSSSPPTPSSGRSRPSWSSPPRGWSRSSPSWRPCSWAFPTCRTRAYRWARTNRATWRCAGGARRASSTSP